MTRVLVWLLGIVSSRAAADAVMGDVLEDLSQRRAAGRAPRWPAAWVAQQLVQAIGAAAIAATPRCVRSAGLTVRDAARALRATPATSAFVILVLAVGITAGTVTFSVVDAVLLKPLPIDRPGQVVEISSFDRKSQAWRLTPELYWQLKTQLPGVQLLGARMTLSGSSVTVGTQSADWSVTHASIEFFQIMQWSAAIGRLWTAEEEARGETDVAVLGYRFWRERFRASPSIIGETVVTDNRRLRVIGVLSANSDHPEIDFMATPVWIPLVPRTGGDIFGAIARLQPGVATAHVANDIQRIAGTAEWRPDVTRLLDGIIEPVRRWMWLALSAAGLVVLIACANAANLLLTRSNARAQEMAIRMFLGASRLQIAGSVLVEGLLLSVAATTCAVLAAVGGVRVARVAITSMLSGVFRAETIALNGRVLAMAAAAAGLTGILVSLVPAWQTSRAQVSSLLSDADGVTATGRRRWRSTFLVAEVAAVVVLTVVSWLFVASLVRASAIDLGFDRDHLLVVNPRMEFQGTVDDVRQRLMAVPGVTDVAVSTGALMPLVRRGAWIDTTIEAADFAAGAGALPLKTLRYSVTPNHFAVLGLRFLRGGTWSAETVAQSPSIVIDERAARQIFGETDPVGRQVRVQQPAGIFTVTGVVPYVYPSGPEADEPPSIYLPLAQNPSRVYARLLVRTSGSADAMLPLVNEVLKPVAPVAREPFVFLPEVELRRLTATRRFNAGLMSTFGLVGMLIGAAGVYAVMAAFVAQQRREIGLRVALGATPQRIQRTVLWRAWRHLATGLALGVPIAWWLSRGFTALLFQVTPADPSVYIGVAGLLVTVGLLAAWVPARRAARTDPLVALRR